jgi:charged multivesicular body protein 5
MNRVFGKKKAAAPAPSLDQASAGIGGRIDGMDQKIMDLEKERRGYKDKIKKTTSPAAKKQLQKRAMEVLKRKRMYEKQRDMASAQQFNIDQTAFSLESTKATIDTVGAMKAASKELRNTMKHDLNIDDVDGLADDMAEMMDECKSLLLYAYRTPGAVFVFVYQHFVFVVSQLMRSMKHLVKTLRPPRTWTKLI